MAALFFGNEYPPKYSHIYGIGFSIKTKIVTLMPDYLAGINDCFMALHLQMANRQHAIVFTACALSRDAVDKIK